MKLMLLYLLSGTACFAEPPYEDLLCSMERPCPEGFVCRSERCVRACSSRDQCPADQTCLNGACGIEPGEEDAGTGADAGLVTEADCASCDLPPAVCLEEDTVYRVLVNLGPCPDDPSQCAFAAFDMDCPACTESCLVACRDRTCDELQGGCRQAGYCVPGPSGTGAACAYVEEVDSSTCTTTIGEDGLCESGVCTATVSNPLCEGVSCDDSNPCTDDSCDPVEGCVHVDNQVECDDGDLCTHGDRCSSRACTGTPITCASDDCVERECDGTPSCTETPRPLDTPCADDSRPCTRDVCDGSGACIHPALPSGTQCGAAASQRCCSAECVDISTDNRHCGGCGSACDPGFGCEPIESTTECGPSYPAQVSGRCLCQGANSQCPDNRGQVCRLTQFLDGNRCVPDSSTAMPCAPGQHVEVIDLCPGYCAY